jgi:transposase-like protein
VDEPSRSKRGEAREFWETAIRLWKDSGLSVREFCRREGLAEHGFYSWRRELLSDGTLSATSHESSDANGDEVAADGRRRRKRKPVAAGDMSEAAIASPFIELAAPQLQRATSAGLCHCTLELENTDGMKMRILLQSVATPDLAAISRSFWNHPS